MKKKILIAAFLLALLTTALLLFGRRLVPLIRGDGGSVDVFARPAQTAAPPAAAEAGSRWYGSLVLEPDGDVDGARDGETEVWAMLDAADDGSLLFRVYAQQRPKKADIPLLSLRCAPGEDRFEILPDPDGSRILEQSFPPGTAPEFTLRLDRGRLLGSCGFDDGQRRGTLLLELFPL